MKPTPTRPRVSHGSARLSNPGVLVNEAYFDHAGGGVIDPRVRTEMEAVLAEIPASAHGLHQWAATSHRRLERARASVAALVGADPTWVIFTAGPTEARNLAVKGTLAANRRLGGAVTATVAEHPATLSACRSATRDTGGPTLVAITGDGHVDPHVLGDAVGPETALVCLTHAQPEIGTLLRLDDLIAAVRAARPDVIVHVDSGDSIGLAPVNMAELDIDLLTIGGASLGAPPWSGALVVRPGTRLHPLIEGGIHEHGKRAGAEDLPSIAGLGRAAEIARADGDAVIRRVEGFASVLTDRLLAVPDVHLTGPRSGRLPGHVSITVGRVEAQTLVLALAERGVAASPGSACTAVTRKVSPVLEAIGLEPPLTHSAIVFTLGFSTTQHAVDYGANAFSEVVASLRKFSPIGDAA